MLKLFSRNVFNEIFALIEADQHKRANCLLHKNCGKAAFAKTAGLSDKTGKFSICPAENFSLSDKCPVISGKKR